MTCDAKLAARRDLAACLFLLPQAAGRMATFAYFLALTDHFQLVVGPDDLMARCAHCNSHGYDLVSPATAAATGVVPAKLLHSEQDFWRCRHPACQHLYWRGSKTQDTRELFSQLLIDEGVV